MYFPNTIRALDFPVLEYPGTLWLRISFGMILELADILYNVNFEDYNLKRD